MDRREVPLKPIRCHDRCRVAPGHPAGRGRVAKPGPLPNRPSGATARRRCRAWCRRPRRGRQPALEALPAHWRLSTGAVSADRRYRPDPHRYRPEFGIGDAGYRPDLLDIDRSSGSETPDIDRTSSLSTGVRSRRRPISTGPRRYRPELGAGDSGYRPDLSVIDRSSGVGDAGDRISTGPPLVIDRSYRPELRIGDARYRPDLHGYRPEFGVGGAGYRPELRRRRPTSTGPPPGDRRHRTRRHQSGFRAPARPPPGGLGRPEAGAPSRLPAQRRCAVPAEAGVPSRVRPPSPLALRRARCGPPRGAGLNRRSGPWAPAVLCPSDGGGCGRRPQTRRGRRLPVDHTG